MGETKFTPGDWQWDSGLVPPDGPERYADIYTDGGETIIARFNDSLPEGRANAALMANSKALYEALQETLTALELFGSQVNWGKSALSAGCIQAVNEAPLKARQALAKARGELP